MHSKALNCQTGSKGNPRFSTDRPLGPGAPNAFELTGLVPLILALVLAHRPLEEVAAPPLSDVQNASYLLH